LRADQKAASLQSSPRSPSGFQSSNTHNAARYFPEARNSLPLYSER